MRVQIIIRILGLFLLLFSLTLLVPAAISVLYGDGELVHFTGSIFITAFLGIMFWYPVRDKTGNLRSREAFIVVCVFWVVLGFIGSLPFILGAHLSIADAAFEAVSAFTTTGATTIIGLDELPQSILFYRQQLQWYGGLGVIVLAIAILPMLGVGGMRLYKAETPGPMKDEKLSPRIAQTARMLWTVYVGFTIACALAYWLAGMSAFDAIAHSLSTVSTGGFSTHDRSLAYFDSPLIESIAIVFMLLGGISFGIHFMVYQKMELSIYWKDSQTKVFLWIVLILIVISALVLFLTGYFPDLFEAFRYSAFQVVSVITSTGFGTSDFSTWPLLLPALLIFSSFIGGCAGSTAGGMKIIRFVLLFKVGGREIVKLIHPYMVRPIKLAGSSVENRVVDGVWGFFSLYVFVFAVFVLLVMATGVDQITAFGAVATCLNNLGPGLGDTASNFASINVYAKWLLTWAMLLGRLEIFTIVALLIPDFWTT